MGLRGNSNQISEREKESEKLQSAALLLKNRIKIGGKKISI